MGRLPTGRPGQHALRPDRPRRLMAPRHGSQPATAVGHVPRVTAQHCSTSRRRPLAPPSKAARFSEQTRCTVCDYSTRGRSIRRSWEVRPSRCPAPTRRRARGARRLTRPSHHAGPAHAPLRARRARPRARHRPGRPSATRSAGARPAPPADPGLAPPREPPPAPAAAHAPSPRRGYARLHLNPRSQSHAHVFFS